MFAVHVPLHCAVTIKMTFYFIVTAISLLKVNYIVFNLAGSCAAQPFTTSSLFVFSGIVYFCVNI